MGDKELSITFPEGFVSALNRRHNWAEYTKEEILTAFAKIDFLYQKYKEVTKKLDYHLNIYWEEKKVEKHFNESRWYYAHRRLKQLEVLQKELHKKMFYLLISFDGNGGETFSQFHCISAEEIYKDFRGKYMGSPNLNKTNEDKDENWKRDKKTCRWRKK